MAEAAFASDFVDAVTDEIERFTSTLPTSATVYRGADLRYALQRSLYFALIDDQAARRRFRAEGPSAVRQQLHARLVPSLRGSVHRFAKDLVARVKTRHRAPSSGELVFGVIHPKFVRYAQSIGVGNELFYCGTHDTLHAQLAASGVRSVLAPAEVPWRRLRDSSQPYLSAFGLQRELDAHLAFLERHRPRACVVLEGNAPFDEVMNQACKLVGVPCVCIQHGWSPIIHVAFRHFSFTEMLVWGDEFGRLLSAYSPGQRFVATGSHVVGPMTTDARTGDAVSFFLQAPSAMIDDIAWARFLALIRTVAERLPAARVLVREHPSHRLDASARTTLRLPNVQIVDPATTPLTEQLEQSCIGASLFSTTLLETAASGAVPVVVNARIIRTFVPSLAGVGIEAATWDEAEQAIVRLFEDTAFREQHTAQQPELVQRFFNGVTRDAAKAALRARLLGLTA